jgi:hypothetical protein
MTGDRLSANDVDRRKRVDGFLVGAPGDVAVGPH